MQACMLGESDLEKSYKHLLLKRGEGYCFFESRRRRNIKLEQKCVLAKSD